MPLRLATAAAMAAILATLAVMIARAVVDPPHVPDIAAREAFLLQHVGVGLAGALVLQLAFYWAFTCAAPAAPMTAFDASGIASCGCRFLRASVIRVSRVPKQKTSTFWLMPLDAE